MMKTSEGFNALDLAFQECNGLATEFQKKLIINDTNKTLLSSLIDKIDSNNFATTKEKGDALETLTRTALESLKFFDAEPNVHTSTNEIDFLCNLNKAGTVAKSKGYFSLEDHFLIECKNYASPVNVTFVGKFASLLISHKKSLGILVSTKGITGSGWNHAYGLTKKLYLKCNILIISFTLDDFRELLNNSSFFDIIDQKKTDIINDTNINRYLTHHPAQE